MASLTLITVTVLAMLVQTCKCEIPGLPNYSLEQEISANGQYSGHNVVYVPVCSPPCATSSPHQLHSVHSCQQQEQVDLPLQQSQYDHNQQQQLGYGGQQQLGYEGQQQLGYEGQQQLGYGGQQQLSYSGQQQLGYGGQKQQQQGNAAVHQQITQHGAQQQQTIHHGSGVSHQSFQQDHQQQVQQVYGAESEKSDELTHQKDQNIHYKFEYSVNDHKTGDIKLQREERRGDVVTGEYSLLEEDGNVRTVKYYADWKTGFHAQVHNSKPKSVG